MQITKNWFYKLSEINSEEIIIEDNLIISIFDDLCSVPHPDKGRLGGVFVSIWENSKVEIFWVLENKDDFKLKVIQEKDNSNLKLNYLILSKNISPLQGGDVWKTEGGKIKAKIESVLNSNFVKSNVQIISIVWNWGEIDLDWIIKIEKGIEKVDWNLSEENIFLWDTGMVKWIPTLLVWSSDVKASHSCKMERISDEKLFYLRSRWLGRENALNMIIEAKIENLFSCLRMYNKDFYEEILDNILGKFK